MVNTWKPVLAALVIFATGVVTGGLTVNLRRSPWSHPNRPPTGAGVVRPGKPERSGAQSGFALRRPWDVQRPEGQARELSQRMARRLELSPQQRERIEAIVRESQARMKAIADDVMPKSREEFRRMRERIREELTPEQCAKFEEIFKPREDWHRRSDPPLTESSTDPDADVDAPEYF